MKHLLKNTGWPGSSGKHEYSMAHRGNLTAGHGICMYPQLLLVNQTLLDSTVTKLD